MADEQHQTTASGPSIEVQGGRQIHATLVRVRRAQAPDQGTPQPSNEIERASFSTMAKAGTIATSRFDPYYLALLPQNSAGLPQRIRALVNGIVGQGSRLVPTLSTGWDGTPREAAAEAEWQRGTRFLRACAVEDASFDRMMRVTESDVQTVGYGLLEKLRTNQGDLAGLKRLAAPTIRFAYRDKQATKVTRRVHNFDGTEWTDESYFMNFRRYVQIVGAERVWFKESGDPRRVLTKDGTVDTDVSGKPVMMGRGDWGNPDFATEVVLFEGDPDPNGEYPLPSFVGAIPEIGGMRAAADTNYDLFDNDGIPPFLIFTSSPLTPDATKNIQDLFAERSGRDNRNRGLIIEAENGKGNGLGPGFVPGATLVPKLEFVPLTDHQRGDAMFRLYTQDCDATIGSVMSVPKILSGRSDDYNRATAEVAVEVAEMWVYRPQRSDRNAVINRHIMADIGILYWEFAFDPPRLSNPDSARAMVEAGVKAGIGVPDDYAPVVNEHLGLDVTTGLPWGDRPFEIAKIQEQMGGATAIDLTGQDMTTERGVVAAVERIAAETERAYRDLVRAERAR